MATTFLIAKFVDQGLVDLFTPIGDLGFPGTIGDLTLADLLAHRSGLPAWRPYYLLSPDPDLATSYRLALSQEPLVAKIGERTIYSDLNFLILGFLAQDIGLGPLDEVFAKTVADPNGLKTLGFRPQWGPLAPTEDGPRVGGPLTYPGLPTLGSVPLGRVHDDNALALGGVAGQAGLFGDAGSVFALIAHLAGVFAGRPGLISKKTLALFLEPQPVAQGPPTRALGFALGEGPLTGYYGHYGYTGCDFWWHPQKDWAFALLTNRVQPTATNQKIASFRRALAALLTENA